MDFSAITLAVWGGLASNVFYFLSKYGLKRGEDTLVQTWFYWSIRSLIFLPFALTNFSLTFSPLNLTMLGLLGFTEMVGGFLYMKMHEHADLSLSTILSRTRLIWVPLLAFIFLGERLKMNQYIGSLILFIGLSVISSPKKVLFDKGIQYSYVSAFLLAVIAIMIKFCSTFASPTTILTIQALIPTLVFPIFVTKAKTRFIKGLKKDILIKCAIAIFQALSGYLILLAYKNGSVSIASGVYQSMMIFSIAAGILFLGERKDIGKKLLGSVITIIGVLFLVW